MARLEDRARADLTDGPGPDDSARESGRRVEPQLDDPTLKEMLSLTHWWVFVIETIALLAVIVVLQNTLFKSSSAGSGMPHPYWIPVLLASCQYGALGGLFATFASSAVYLFTAQPQQTADLDFYAYAAGLAGQPAAWCASALILGGLRSLHIRHTLDVERLHNEAVTIAEALSDALTDALAEIKALERRIALDTSTVAALSRGLADLDMSDRRAAARSFSALVGCAVAARSFTIYVTEDQQLQPVYAVSHDRPLPLEMVGTDEQLAIERLVRTGHLDASATSAGQIAGLVRRPSDDAIVGAIHCVGSDLPPGLAGARLTDLCRLFATLLASNSSDHGGSP
ncbi:MAG: hypothetical protein JSS20_20985 [Proteobacteria bacterium]|nr:hypothetical protein [Pseudomonadota bacterium]